MRTIGPTERVLAVLAVLPIVLGFGWLYYQVRVKAAHLEGDYRYVYALLGLVVVSFLALAVVLAFD